MYIFYDLELEKSVNMCAVILDEKEKIFLSKTHLIICFYQNRFMFHITYLSYA
jgi:hypothetical protein